MPPLGDAHGCQRCDHDEEGTARHPHQAEVRRARSFPLRAENTASRSISAMNSDSLGAWVHSMSLHPGHLCCSVA